MIKNIDQVVLGTVQFGLDYGVSNMEGRTDNQEVNKILTRGYELGLRELDTAPSYGNAESIIVQQMNDNYKINTKLLPFNFDDKEIVLDRLEASINIIGSHLNSIAIHKVEDLCNENVIAIIESLRRYKKNIKLGVSIYNLEDLYIIKNSFDPDFIQLPFNIYDQRFKDSELLDYFKSYGCEIHVRSVFLQGLLLMSIFNIPRGMKSVVPIQKKLIKYSQSLNLSIYKMCLSWVMNQDWVDKIVVGVNNSMQLETLVKTINELIREENSGLDCSIYRIDDTQIINPANWS